MEEPVSQLAGKSEYWTGVTLGKMFTALTLSLRSWGEERLLHWIVGRANESLFLAAGGVGATDGRGLVRPGTVFTPVAFNWRVILLPHWVH